MKPVKFGSGFTARIVGHLVDWQNQADLDAATADFRRWKTEKDQLGLFGQVAKGPEARCKEILSAAGLKEGVPPSHPLDDDTPESLAFEILSGIRTVKEDIDCRDPDIADRIARIAFLAGVRWAQADLKWREEKHAIRGTKVAGGERNSAHKTNAKHEPLRNRRFSRMAELVPEMGVDKAAAQCETEGLGHRDAIKKQWNRFKKRDT